MFAFSSFRVDKVICSDTAVREPLMSSWGAPRHRMVAKSAETVEESVNSWLTAAAVGLPRRCERCDSGCWAGRSATLVRVACFAGAPVCRPVAFVAWRCNQWWLAPDDSPLAAAPAPVCA
eukprot:scaffold2360_cov380-Prasinococcus_capsulatus_cf.AAC.2